MLEGKLSTNNVYKVKLEPKFSQMNKFYSASALKATTFGDIRLWHRRMGHLNAVYLKQLRQAAIGVDFDDDKMQQCEICVTGKLIQKPFQSNSNHSMNILELIHSDVCQVEDLSIGKARYFITFLDDCSRKIFVYFLKHKDEVPEIVRKFIKFVENQTGYKVKILWTDNGGEYLNTRLRSTPEELGIKHETSIAYQPQQNGRAERVNRILIEKARCMLAESKLPYRFWAEAVFTACYLANRSPKRCLGGRTPEELWTGYKPDLSNLKVFGCKTRSYIPSHQRKKMEPTSRPAIMLGYCEKQKGHRLWSESDQKIFTASNVEFFETEQHVQLSPNTVYLPVDSAPPADLCHDELHSCDEFENIRSEQNSPGINEKAAIRENIVLREHEAFVNSNKPQNEEIPVNKKQPVNRKRKIEPKCDDKKRCKVDETTTQPSNKASTSNVSRPVTRSVSRLIDPDELDDTVEEYLGNPTTKSQR